MRSLDTLDNFVVLVKHKDFWFGARKGSLDYVCK